MNCPKCNGFIIDEKQRILKCNNNHHFEIIRNNKIKKLKFIAYTASELSGAGEIFAIN